MSKRIPHSHPKVVKIGPLRIILIDQIGAAQQVYGEIHGLRHRGGMNADARTRFYEIGPVLPLVVKRQIPVDVELRAKIPRPYGEANARLRVDQRIVTEAADENGVERGIRKEPGRFAAKRMADASRRADSASI